MRLQLLTIAVLTLACIKPSLAQDSAPWASDVSSAFQYAKQQNRPVLLHFWSESCRPCRELDTYVFPNPGFAQAMFSTCIPVKVNVNENETLARRYGITRIPTDVVVKPNGEEIIRTSSPRSVEGYRSLMQQVSNQSSFQRQPDLQQVAEVARQPDTSWASNTKPVGHNDWSGGGGNFPGGGGGFQPANSNAKPPSHSQPPANWSADASRNSSATGPAAAPANNQTWQNPPPKPPQGHIVDNQFTPANGERQPSTAARQQNPPLGLDGYCPVSMMERKEWKKGDARWGIRHRGRTYLFAGEQELNRFWADPDAFSPVLSGYDPVLLIEQKRWVSGKRDFGVFYRNPVTQRQHIYLFADEQSLQRFENDPGNYARVAHQAMMENAVGRRQTQQ